MENWAFAEMKTARIKDARRRKSMANVLENLAERPSESFSAAAGPAGRQAAQRLFSQETIQVSHLLAGHYQQTIARIGSECRGGLVLVVQDTTEFDFTGHKATKGLGYVNDTKARGLFSHSALAVTPDGLPLGLLHLNLFVRQDDQYGKASQRRDLDIEQKESYRWIQTLRSVEKKMPVGQHVLFVQDREADIFAFLEAAKRPSTYVLVRANQSRKVEVESESAEKGPTAQHLFDAACRAPVVGRMYVHIPHAPGRHERVAELVVQSLSLRIVSPSRRKGVSGNSLAAWVVRACELNPPPGQVAIEWILVTTMPTPDGPAACELVAFYAKRWTIERLHYTVKSGGCRAEALQMDDVHALGLAISLYYVTAWRLMHLTYLARVDPTAPPESILGPTEIEVIECIRNKPISTAEEAVVSIAQLGGYQFYKNAPAPGIKVLWLGFRRLQDMEAGWVLAKGNDRSPPCKL
jgi:hypothetical protein